MTVRKKRRPLQVGNALAVRKAMTANSVLNAEQRSLKLIPGLVHAVTTAQENSALHVELKSLREIGLALVEK